MRSRRLRPISVPWHPCDKEADTNGADTRTSGVPPEAVDVYPCASWMDLSSNRGDVHNQCLHCPQNVPSQPDCLSEWPIYCSLICFHCCSQIHWTSNDVPEHRGYQLVKGNRFNWFNLIFSVSHRLVPISPTRSRLQSQIIKDITKCLAKQYRTAFEFRGIWIYKHKAISYNNNIKWIAQNAVCHSRVCLPHTLHINVNVWHKLYIETSRENGLCKTIHLILFIYHK